MRLVDTRVKSVGRSDRPVMNMRQPRTRFKAAALFCGTCYAPNGVATGGMTDGTKPWVEFNEDNWTFTEIVGPVATPWAAHRQYRLKADLAGPWYASLNG